MVDRGMPAGGPRWCGRWTVALLALVVASGVALVPFYAPERPLQSLEGVAAGVPWAWWLRGVHWFAALGLLLCTVGHLVETVWARAWARMPAGAWWRAVLLLPLLVAAMLGGFALRGDAEAVAALSVWRGVVASIPGSGADLATLLLGPAGGGLGAVALHHAGTFTIGFAAIASEHVRRPWPEVRAFAIAALVVAVAAALIPVGLGAAVVGPGGLIGPWYLLGVQGALLDLPVEAGWIGPLLPVVALGMLRHAGERARPWVIGGLIAWIVAYAGFTVRALLHGAQ